MNNELVSFDDQTDLQKNTEDENSTLSEYREIINQIKDDEEKIEKTVLNVEALAAAVGSSVAEHFPNGKNNKAIFYDGMPDILQAAARLLDISINGRHKVAMLRRSRASILKDATGGKTNSDDDLEGMFSKLD